MDCPACAKPISDEDRFCKHCGKRLGVPALRALSGAVEEMEREYRQGLADKPDNPDAHYNVGLANLYSGNYEAAAEAFRAVIDLLPDEPSGYEKLAIALAKLDRREEALRHAHQACRLSPESEAMRRLLRSLGG